MNNSSRFFSFQESDVVGSLALLSRCAPHYLDGALAPGCRGGGCGAGGPDLVPPGCRQHNAVYTILHYLTDTDFPSTKVILIVKCTNIFTHDLLS